MIFYYTITYPYFFYRVPSECPRGLKRLTSISCMQMIRLTDACHGITLTASFPAPGLHSKLLISNQLQKLPVLFRCSETPQA